MTGRPAACCILAASLALTGGWAPPPVAAAMTPQTAAEPSCPGYVNVDRRRLARLVEAAGSSPSGYLDRVSVPEEVTVRPEADARVVIQAALPESAMDPTTTLAVVWQDAAGAWWYWRRTFDYSWVRQSAPNADGTITWEPERYPPSTGSLPAPAVEQVEFLLSHPCRTSDPAVWPRETPLRSGRTRECPLDAASYVMRIQRRDGAVENISAPCENETMTFQLIKTVLGR